MSQPNRREDTEDLQSGVPRTEMTSSGSDPFKAEVLRYMAEDPASLERFRSGKGTARAKPGYDLWKEGEELATVSIQYPKGLNGVRDMWRMGDEKRAFATVIGRCFQAHGFKDAACIYTGNPHAERCLLHLRKRADMDDPNAAADAVFLAIAEAAAALPPRQAEGEQQRIG